VLQVSTSRSRKLSVGYRLLLAGIAIIGLMLLTTAHSLEPDPRGYGTHEQLGLTPCFFQKTTGHLCPTCGATTAWSHALHGNFARAAAANLGGVLSCAATVVGVPWLLLTATLGHWPIAPPRLRPALIVLAAWLLVVVCDWLRRILLG